MADRTISILVKLKENVSDETKKMGKAVAASVGVMGIAVAKMAIDAAPLEGVKGAFEGIAVASGESADEMLAALQRGSQGMVAQRDLMMTYNNAAQLVSTTFANQLPEAMGYLSKVSAATGQDMGYMLDSLVKGVGRLSPMILDNLAIQVTLADATKRASEMYGVQADKLNKAQIQAGMMSVTMEALAKNTAAMPEVAGSAAQQIGEFKASMADLRDEVGTAALPALKAVMGVLNDLQPSTMLLAVGLTTVTAAAIKGAGGFGQFAEILGSSKGRVAGLGVELAILVGALDRYKKEMTEMDAAQAKANISAASMGNQVRALMADGMELGDATAVMTGKINKSIDAYNKDAVASGILGNIFGANAKMAATMTTATESLNRAIVTSVGSYEEYKTEITAVNATITDGIGKARVMTEAQYEMARATAESGGMFVSFGRDIVDGLTEQIIAAEQSNEATRERLNLTERQAQAEAMATQTARDAMLATEGLTAADTALVTTRMSSASTSREIMAARAAEADAAAAMQEKAARVTDMAAAAAQRQADADMAAAAAAGEAAVAQANLAQQIMGKTDAAIKDAIVSSVDPADVGIEAWTGLAVELGVVDEKSAALAGAIPQLTAAWEAGIIPTENMSEAVAAFSKDAEDGEIKTGALLDQFAKAPGLIGPSADKLASLNTKLEMTGEAGPKATEGLDGFVVSVEGAIGPTQALRQEVQALGGAMSGMGGGMPTPASPSNGGSGGQPTLGPGGAQFGGGAGQRGGNGTVITIYGPLVNSAIVRNNEDIAWLARLVADELASRVSLRGAYSG